MSTEIGKIARRLGGRIDTISLADIGLTERFRKNYGDINELALSLGSRGQLQNIVVCSCETDGLPFRLLAGGRRYKAMSEVLKWTTAQALIFDHELSPLEMLEIEWEENSIRKDFDWKEDCALKAKILELRIGTEGHKIGGGAKLGVSLREVSSELGIGASTLSIDRKLNAAVTALPEIFEGVKSKTQAIKLLNKAHESSVRKELARRTQSRIDSSNSDAFLKNIVDRFIVGNFFTGIKDIPNGSINFVEIDPPYAIDLKTVKLHPEQIAFSKYNEITPTDYPMFIANVLQETFRVMATHSYGILWHAPEWRQRLYELLKAIGFETTLICGIWTKSQAQANMPTKYLASAYENFFYFWKGNPSIVKEGRLNVFRYDGVPHQRKYHPTQRPIDLMTDILSTFCFEGAQVCVPFVGSGVTILAAEHLKMKAFGWELSPEYKDGFILAAEKEFGRVNNKLAALLGENNAA
jgi:site-specific DNA-methyltransferase (adenine-specific)